MASNSVCFNGKTAVHKDSGGILTSFPDVCLTPIIIPIPIPYTNTALSIDADKTASSVKVNGQPICNKDSNFAKSTGDEAGSVGGILSGTTAGKAEFITFSANVFVEGAPVVRMGDQMVSNNKNTFPVPLQQAGANNPSIAELTALCAQPVPSRHKLALEVAGAEMKGLTGELMAENADGETFHLALGRDTWAEQQRRQLFFENLPQDSYILSLIFSDKKYGNYKVPLGRDLTVCDKAEEKPEWNTVLVPVLPRCHRDFTTNKTSAGYPRQGGWIYIFKNGYIWRELHVVEGNIPGQFSDVNLTYSKGKDERPPTSISTDSRIVVPYMVGGNCPKIEMCFSEVQWSWEYIQKMGGMDPEDIRHNHGPSVGPCPDEAQASQLRKKRMQTVDLSNYPEFPDKKDDKEWVVKSWQNNDPKEGKHLEAHQNSKIPVVILKDPLGVAHKLSDSLMQRVQELKMFIESLETGVKPDPKNPTHHTETTGLSEDELKTRNNIKAQFELASILYQVGFSKPEGNPYGDDLNEALIKQLLGVKERQDIRQRISNKRRTLFKYIKEDAKDDYEAALGDYVNNIDERKIDGKGWLSIHIQAFAYPANILDRHLDVPADREDDGLAEEVGTYLDECLFADAMPAKLLRDSAKSKQFDILQKAGSILDNVAQAFSQRVTSDVKILEKMVAIFNSIEGRNAPQWQVQEVTHTYNPIPEGYREVPGASRKEIVEHIGDKMYKTVTDTKPAKAALSRSGIKASSGLTEVAPSIRNIHIFQASTDVAAAGALSVAAKEVRVFQIVEKTDHLAKAAKDFTSSHYYTYGFQSFLGILEVINLTSAGWQLKKNGMDKKELANVTGAILGAGGFGFSVRQHAMKLAGKKLVAASAKAMATRLNGASIVFGSIVSGISATRCFKEDDDDAGAAHVAAAAMGGVLLVAMAASAGLIVTIPIILIGVGFMVLAAYLEDDPLEKFAKHSPFQQAGFNYHTEVWPLIEEKAKNPIASEKYPKWKDLQFCRLEIMGLLFYYDTEMYIRRAFTNNIQSGRHSTMGCHGGYNDQVVSVADHVQVTCTFRKFIHNVSSLESHPLRIYPDGLGEYFHSLAPYKTDYQETEDNDGIKTITFYYDIPNELQKQCHDMSLILFISRQLVSKGTGNFVPTPTIENEARFHTACKPAVEVRQNNRELRHGSADQLAHRTGTMDKITKPAINL